ncbi:tyrosine-type recombinase/integrase [Prevotella sp.]|uniref:tyrosine-type recombinase/integrase n=1 Tax=Prevotella sp. TaxID=59823 RepID=UPI003AB88BA4
MATIKLKFRPSSVPSTQGTIYYQVIHNRSVKWLTTHCHVYSCEWDSLNASIVIPPDTSRRQELLNMQCCLSWNLRQRKTIVSRLSASSEGFSFDSMTEAFLHIPPYKSVFMFLHEQVLQQERMQRYGTLKTYTNAFLRFKEFRNDIDLTFDLLTPDMIEEYEAWLINRNLKQNTIRFYLRTLNTLFHKAMVEGLIPDDSRLFSRVRLAYVTTTKRAISETDIRAIQGLQLPHGSILSLARDIFMFSFYMRGMPFVDIAFLRKSYLRNGMLVYCRRKTNQQLIVEWESEQQEIVERYAHQTESSPYMLPIINKVDGTEYRQYQRMQENVNRALKRIGNMIGLKMPLTTYVARHSWASMARDMNIPISIISEGMGHQSYKTTQVYLNSIDTSRINKANRDIIRRISKRR